MTNFGRPALATGCALVFCLTPASAQTNPPPAPPAMQEPGPAPDMEMMREMMRETMREMMGDEVRRGDRERGPRMMRPRVRDRMARRGGMDHGAMMRKRGDARGHALMHGAAMRVVFAVVDADGDGALSLAEIEDFHGRIFEAVDENGDGRVDMEEIGSFFHSQSGPPDDED